MSRRLLIVLGALGVLAVVVGWRAAADPHPQGPAAARPTPSVHATSTPTDPGDPVTWTEGPWGPATVAGSPVLLPASPTDGPLRDHGNGWADGYAPTALGAAIALLRAGPMVAAAPPDLHDQVDAATLTDTADTAVLIGPVRNTEPAWTLPAALLTASQGATVRLLGVLVDLSGTHAATAVYQAVGGPDGDILTATTYQLTYRARQWRVQSADATTAVPGAPAHYTLPAPGDPTPATD